MDSKMLARSREDDPMTTVNLDAIVFDAGTQVRAAISESVVTDYAERMAEGDEFPPIVVFHDGTHFVLGDGFHRALAAKRNGATTIRATVKNGTKVDAIWFAFAVNRANGHRFTPADKKYAVLLALKTWPDKSQNQIAQQIGCDQAYVSRLKAEVMTSHTLPDRVTGKDGKSYPARRPAPTSASHDAKVSKPADDRSEHQSSGVATRIQRLDPITVIEHTTRTADIEAAVLQSETYLIDFGSVDREQVLTCIGALRNQRRALSTVIHRLESVAAEQAPQVVTGAF